LSRPKSTRLDAASIWRAYSSVSLAIRVVRTPRVGFGRCLHAFPAKASDDFCVPYLDYAPLAVGQQRRAAGVNQEIDHASRTLLGSLERRLASWPGFVLQAGTLDQVKTRGQLILRGNLGLA